jgi:hypothetical protein
VRSKCKEAAAEPMSSNFVSGLELGLYSIVVVEGAPGAFVDLFKDVCRLNKTTRYTHMFNEKNKELYMIGLDSHFFPVH